MATRKEKILHGAHQLRAALRALQGLPQKTRRELFTELWKTEQGMESLAWDLENEARKLDVNERETP